MPLLQKALHKAHVYSKHTGTNVGTKEEGRTEEISRKNSPIHAFSDNSVVGGGDGGDGKGSLVVTGLRSAALSRRSGSEQEREVGGGEFVLGCRLSQIFNHRHCAIVVISSSP